MKFLAAILFLLVTGSAQAASYYFSSVSGDDTRTSTQAQSSATPWRTIAKFNSITFTPGDIIYFKSGETFAGALNTALHGTAANRIIITNYGGSAKAVITSLITPTWTATGTVNIYSTSLDVTRLQVLAVGGIPVAMGRYPNSGYVTITSHNGYSQITGTGVSAIPFNPTGGEAVVRKARFYFDRNEVSSRGSNTLNLLGSSDWGSNTQEVMDDNGFFIQNHLLTLDLDKEWSYSKTSKTAYIFSTTNPNSRNIQVASLPLAFNLNSASYVSISNLKFDGFNEYGFDMSYSHHIDVTNCDFVRIGGDAIIDVQGANFGQGVGAHNITFNTMKYCLNNGTNFVTVDSVKLNNNTLDSIGYLIGLQKSGDAAGNGLHFWGDNCEANFNKVTNVGFNGISWYEGTNILVEKNFVQNFCMTKDDGGAYYTFGRFAANRTNRIIRNNIAINGPGNYDGGLGHYSSFQAYGQAFGVYLDNYSDNVDVINNSIYQASGGGLLNNQHSGAKFKNNLIFDALIGLEILSGTADGVTRNLTVTGNTFILKSSTQRGIYAENYDAFSNVANYGFFDSNYYAFPAGSASSQIIQIEDRQGGQVINKYSLAQWQTAWNKDLHSSPSKIGISDPSNLAFYYNYSNTSLPLSLQGIYKDVKNISFNGSINIPAYSANVISFVSALNALKLNVWKNANGKLYKLSSGEALKIP